MVAEPPYFQFYPNLCVGRMGDHARPPHLVVHILIVSEDFSSKTAIEKFLFEKIYKIIKLSVELMFLQIV